MSARPAEAAPSVYRNRNRAFVAVVVGVVASYVLGVPFSFVRFRSSRPWAPTDVIVAGTILAVVVTCFTVLIAVLLQRYVSLYQSGTSVRGQVVSEVLRGQRGVVVSFLDGSQLQKHSWVFPSRLPVGEATEVIVGAGKLVLVRNGEGYTRASALEQHELPMVMGGAPPG